MADERSRFTDEPNRFTDEPNRFTEEPNRFYRQTGAFYIPTNRIVLPTDRTTFPDKISAICSGLFSPSLFPSPLRAGLRETLLVLDDVWEASVAEAFERVGLSLLVTTREVSGWCFRFHVFMFSSSERECFSFVAAARLYDRASIYERGFLCHYQACIERSRIVGVEFVPL